MRGGRLGTWSAAQAAESWPLLHAFPRVPSDAPEKRLETRYSRGAKVLGSLREGGDVSSRRHSQPPLRFGRPQ